MVAAFLVLTQSIERWPSMSSSQTNGSSDTCGATDCCGGGDCCAAIVTRGREGIASRERRPMTARYLRFVMLAPGDTVPDGCPKLRLRVSVMQAAEDLSQRRDTCVVVYACHLPPLWWPAAFRCTHKNPLSARAIRRPCSTAATRSSIRTGKPPTTS